MVVRLLCRIECEHKAGAAASKLVARAVGVARSMHMSKASRNRRSPGRAGELGFLRWRAHLTYETVPLRSAFPLANRS
jgi:hypothetical protein